MVEELPEVHLRRDLTRAVVDDFMRTGESERVRRGAYAHISGSQSWQRRRQRALAAAVAVQRQIRSAVISHDSAALVHGLSVWRTPMATSVIQATNPRAGLPHDVRRQVGRLSSDDVEIVAGVRVTTLERTLVDCALREHPRDALVIVDSGMRAILRPRRDDDPEELHERTAALRARLLGRIRRGMRGAVQGRAVIEAASPLAESAPESVVRWIAVSRGMPSPVLQKPVLTVRGVVFTDLAWHFRLGKRTLWYHVEYDGDGKYEDTDDRPTTAVLRDERRRESAITDTGDRVVRVYPDEIDDEDLVFAKLTAPIAASVVATYRRNPALYRPPARSRRRH